MNFAIYEIATGWITLIGKGSKDEAELMTDNAHRWVEGVARDASREYVSAERIVPRPDNPSVLNGMALQSLPAPCVISINGVEYGCSDTECELDFTYPGKYKIVVRAFPYIDAEFEVTI